MNTEEKLFPNKQYYKTMLLECVETAKKAGYRVDILEDSNCMFIFLFKDNILCEDLYLPYDRYKPSAEKEISRFENFVNSQYKKALSNCN